MRQSLPRKARPEDGLAKTEPYLLLDAGDEKKMEMIGPYRVTRQAAQAYWPQSQPGNWKQFDAVHHRSSSGGGRWEFHNRLPEKWTISHGPFKFIAKLTGFGHIGLFPEQLENWEWIRQQSSDPDTKVINLFGYTGGSTLAAASGGAQVTHVDASKGVVSWARENAELNGLQDKPVRWIVEDVGRFVEREARRGNVYQGLILDPPSFGRGPRGQVWKIETDLVPLLNTLREIMDPLKFVLLSCHTPGYSPCCLSNILNLVFGVPVADIQQGEMLAAIKDSDLVLPSGTYARWSA